MRMIKSALILMTLSISLLFTFLFVLLNPQSVSLDFFGLYQKEFGAGLLIVVVFVAGFLSSLLLTLIPSLLADFERLRLTKALQKQKKTREALNN